MSHFSFNLQIVSTRFESCCDQTFAMNSSPKKWRRACLLAGTVVLGAATLFGGLMAWLDWSGQTDHAPISKTPSAKTPRVDAIVVLGSRVRVGGEASPSLRRRALHAAQLYHRGIAQNIICTGGVGDNAPAESIVASQILRENGVPSGAIWTETVSRSTWQNAEEAARICAKRGWKRVVVVSEPYHLWRACRNFRAFGLIALASPAANPSSQRRVQASAREALSVLRDWAKLR